MNHFVQLPSGMRANPSHIVYYGQSEHEGQIKLVLTDEPTPWLETMTAEQLDDLLRGPAIVDPIINLDKLENGTACCFTHKGQVRHGIIAYFCSHEGAPVVKVLSHGETITIDL